MGSLEREEIALLARRGLADPTAARLDALTRAVPDAGGAAVVLCCIAATRGLERAFLSRFASRVTALIAAPERESALFDEWGSVDPGAWRKRHVAVDTDGLLLGVVVHAADIQDADSVGDLLQRVKPLYAWLRVVFADSIYNRLAALLACFLAGLVLGIVRRAAGTTGFVVQPRRWVIERSLGWFGRWRRLSKDYEALPEVSEAMVTLAAIRLMLHRLAHPNRRRLPAP